MAQGCTITLPWVRPQARASLNPKLPPLLLPPFLSKQLLHHLLWKYSKGVILKGQDKELHYTGINTTEFSTLPLKVGTSLPSPPRQSS